MVSQRTKSPKKALQKPDCTYRGTNMEVSLDKLGRSRVLAHRRAYLSFAFGKQHNIT